MYDEFSWCFDLYFHINMFSSYSQKEFHIVEINGTWPVALLERFNNGNGLSLFFHGAANEITRKAGKFKQFQSD